MTYDRFKNSMTPAIAEQVKEWRVREHLTWRRVAEVAAAKWPSLDISSGNQLDGYELCNAAMDYLHEDLDDGWN